MRWSYQTSAYLSTEVYRYDSYIITLLHTHTHKALLTWLTNSLPCLVISLINFAIVDADLSLIAAASGHYLVK